MGIAFADVNSDGDYFCNLDNPVIEIGRWIIHVTTINNQFDSYVDSHPDDSIDQLNDIAINFVVSLDPVAECLGLHGYDDLNELAVQFNPDIVDALSQDPEMTYSQLPNISVMVLGISPPEPVSEQPEPVSEQPEPVSEQPEPVSEQPEPVSEQPEPVSEQPEPVSEQPEPVSEQPSEIPSWIKNNASWWADGSIDDDSFVQGLQFLIKEDVLKIPPTMQGSSSNSNEIPSWIKNNASWWADGSIDDDSFIQGIQFLIKEGIMKV